MGCAGDLGRKEVVVPAEEGAAAAAAAAAGEAVITYKRRRVANSSSEAGVPCVNMVACKRSFDEDGHDATAGHWSSWKDTLENLSRLPHISEGGGIHSCISDALKYNPSRSVRKVTNGAIQSSFSKLQDNTDNIQGEAKKQYRVVNSEETDASIASGNGTAASLDANKAICNNVLLDILISEKFALLCDLLLRTFHGNKSKTIIDLDRIDAKMKNGDYAHSPESFDHDVQQIWEKFEKVGREMTDLASNLSIMSRASYQKQACCASEVEVAEHKTEETSLIGAVGIVPKDSTTTTMQLTPCNSGYSTKLNLPEADGLCRNCTCKHCGTKADGQGSLICDGCEAMYHFSCIKPAIKEIPTQSWYCSACSSKGKELGGDTLNHARHDSLHNECVVCGRLDIIKPVEIEIASRMELAEDEQGSSVSSMGDDKKPDLSTTALSRLCKHCGTCEDDDKKFLICGHLYCPYKFYHIRCLKTSQIASAQQQYRPCWYCPSCLCRECFIDKDDDQIVLCDGCDEAYHMYCMKPPRASIPKGQWYCIPCSIERAKKGMRLYEQSILQRHGNVKHVSDAKGAKVLLFDGPDK